MIAVTVGKVRPDVTLGTGAGTAVGKDFGIHGH
jgi:hypothetical protein